MKGSGYKSSRMLILLTGMAVLLPLLAVLQYYWLGQVSEGASERLQSNLRAGAVAFRHDFNREFIRAYVNFHMDSFGPANNIDIGEYHAERLEQWNQTAPHPRLINGVFAVNYDARDQPQLSRLEPRSKSFEAIEWAGEFANWHDRFVRRDEGAHLQTPSSRTPLESFAVDIPALIIPFPQVAQDKSQNQSAPLPSGFTIVKLDLNYIQHDFIPSLIQLDLFDDSHTEYKVAVVGLEDPPTVIFSSSYALSEVSSSDVSTRIFGLEADELRTFLSNEAVPLRSTEAAGRPLRLINLRFLKSSAGTSGTASGGDEGRWQLLIKHRTGSLAAVVNSTRRRNLAISFGILLLLGAGIFMTAISTRRAERLAQQQINFVAGVSHELRTPLAVICSAGENLAHGIVQNPEKVAQYGEVIHREGKRLTDMVEQVLEFAGAQSAQTARERFDFRPTDVSEFIDGAVAACQVQLQERHFRIQKQLEPNLPPVEGDCAALQRVMQNLIGNAIKYGKNDGAQTGVLISAQTSGEKRNELKISVADEGLGINSSDLPHIFEPFFRGQAAVAAQIEGSGVGLSLVKQIVEAHGGRIDVRSTPGSGSVFTFSLPVASSAPVESKAKPSHANRQS